MKTGTIIDVDSFCRVVYDGYSYQPILFDAGGQDVRDPRTGEMVVSKPKWVVQQKWFSTLSSCLFWMAQQLVARQQDVFDIKTYIQEMKTIEEVFRVNYDN